MIIFLASTSTSAGEESASGGGTFESIKNVLANPIFYIAIGCLLFLVIAVYLIRRFVRVKPNTTVIVLRHGKIHKVLDSKNSKYFLVPFIDSVGGIIANEEKVFSSDKLFINNGPDALYKINYTLTYKILDPKKYYNYLNNLNSLLPVRLNDELRLYADQGNALVLIKEYREKKNEIISVINKTVIDYSIEVVDFKINIIEPIGK